MLYRFSRWRTLGRNFTSGFGFADAPLFRRSMSINKPNFVVTAQSTSELQLLPVWKTNVRHIGIRLPVLIRTTSLYSACNSASGCQICMLYRYSRSRPLRRNFTSGFRLGDVALSRSVSISKPNFVVITQSTAEI